MTSVSDNDNGVALLLSRHIDKARTSIARLKAAMAKLDLLVMEPDLDAEAVHPGPGPAGAISTDIPGPCHPLYTHGSFVVATPVPQPSDIARFGLAAVPDHPRVWMDLVVDFHADPTGARDSSPALAAAILACHRAGGHCTVFVPAGTFTFELVPGGSAARPTPPVMQPMTLRGCGPMQTRLRFAGSRRNDRFPIWLGTSDLRVTNLSLEYCGTPPAHHHPDAVDTRETDTGTPGSVATVARVDVIAVAVTISGFQMRLLDPLPTLPSSLGRCIRSRAKKTAAQTDSATAVNMKGLGHGSGCVVCGTTGQRIAAERLLTAFEIWLEADRQHVGGASPAVLHPLFQQAAGLLTDRGLLALLLGNAAEMLLRCGRWDEAAAAALEAVQAAEDAQDTIAWRENIQRLGRAKRGVGGTDPETTATHRIFSGGGDGSGGDGDRDARREVPISSDYFGRSRNCMLLAGLSGSLDGKSAELEAAHMLRIGREAWRHIGERTPWETSTGDKIGFTAQLPDDVVRQAQQRSLERQQEVQEIDMSVGQAPLWCEVKDSGLTNHNQLQAELQQLRRYHSSARRWQQEHHLTGGPAIAIIFSQAVDPDLAEKIEATGDICICLADVAGVAKLPIVRAESVSAAWFRGAVIPQEPAPTPLKVVLDQGVMAILVADIWDMTVDDMVAAGASSFNLFGSPINVSEPGDFLKFLRPWKRFVEGCDLYVCPAAIDSFAPFIELRGSDKEREDWATALETGRVTVVNPSPAALAWVTASCVAATQPGKTMPPSTPPTIACAVDIGGTAFTDQEGLCTRLRYRADFPVARGMESKVRASYLRTPIPGRKANIECASVCGRTLPHSRFSYRARQTARDGTPVACKSCAACDEVVDSIINGIIVGEREAQARRAKAMRRWQKVIRRAVHDFRQSADATADDVTTSERLRLLRMAIDGTQPAGHRRRGKQSDDPVLLGRPDCKERLLSELRGWCREAGTEPGSGARNVHDDEPDCLMEF